MQGKYDKKWRRQRLRVVETEREKRMDWWKEKKFRIIQSRLRDIDAGMDIEKFVEELCEFQADVCVISCGGSTAFYPTELKYQRSSPYLTDDFFGSLLHKCHERGIKVIAGFDFGKAYIKYNEQSLEKNLEKIQKNRSVDGGYKENYQNSIQCILDEVMDLYPIDGIFIENLWENNSADEKKLRDGIRRHIRKRREDLLIWITPETEKIDKIQTVLNEACSHSRFMGQSLEKCSFDLYLGIARGRHLLWGISGSFETCPDRSNFDQVKKIFRFHKQFEKLWTEMQFCAEILLITPPQTENQAEYLGLHRILKESSLVFDEMPAKEAESIIGSAEYQLVIFPGIEDISEMFMEKAEENGICFLATGAAFRHNPEIVEKYFGVRLKEKSEQSKGNYMLTEPETIFSDFDRRDWIFLDGDFYYMLPSDNNKNYLPLIRYEFRDGNEYYTITEQSCVSVREGKSAYIPWMPGTLYETKGYEDYKKLFLDILKKDCLKKKQMIEWKGAPYVEIFAYRCGKNRYLLQMLNRSGNRGKFWWPPIPVKAGICIKGVRSGRIRLLEDSDSEETFFDKEVVVTVDGIYQAVLVESIEQGVMEVQQT